MEWFNNWLNALRSGEYKQAFDTFHDEEECSFCALGVLLDCNGINVTECTTRFGAASSLTQSKIHVGAVVYRNDFEHESFEQIADWLEKSYPELK